MTETTKPISIGFRRLAAASAVAGLFAFALTVTITPAAVNEISALCHNSGTLVGWLYRVLMAGFFVCVPLGGWLADRYGKLPILCIGCVLMAVGSWAFASVSNYPLALLTMLLMGSGGGFSEAICMGIVADVYTAEKRTAMMNWAQVSFAAGAVVGPLGVAWLLSADISWRWAYLVTAVICAGAMITSYAAAVRREERQTQSSEKSDLRALFKDKLLMLLSLGILFYVAAEGGQANWAARYFKEVLHAPGPLAASTVALFWAGIGGGRMLAAWTSRHLSDYAIICLSLGLALTCQVALLLVNSPVPALVAIPLLGFGLAPIWPTIVSRASGLHPNQTGTVLGIVVSAGSLGGAIFPAAIGQAADHIGLRSALWTCVGLLVANLVIFVPLWRRHRQ